MDEEKKINESKFPQGGYSSGGTGGLIAHIEALIFASDKPLTALEITELINQAFGFMDDKIEVEQIDVAIEGMVEKYSSELYPFEIKESGGGWQFLTKKDFHKTVAQLNGEKFLKRLSPASLETLAIVAYKQPVTKGEIESIRGVSTDYAMQKLLEKELVIITGRNEKLPGHPLVYATSKTFMDYFGINSSEDLPKIKDVLANHVIEPTVVHHTSFEQSETLIVSGEGELLANKAAIESDEPQPDEHVFEKMNVDEESVEDAPTEEAIEEYIADELFIEADEEVEIEEILDKDLPDENSSPGNEAENSNDESEENYFKEQEK